MANEPTVRRGLTPYSGPRAKADDRLDAMITARNGESTQMAKRATRSRDGL